MAFQPTPKQREILEIRNKNIAVSASAGSGKTSTMIERISDLILKDKIPVKNMLIVTFTNSASAEMKERLANNLEEKIRTEQDFAKRQFLIKQTEDLNNANICTIDKFCINILKKYYYFLELDGNFEIIDDLENEKLEHRAFEVVIKELNSANGETINKICDTFLENRKLNNLKDLADKVLATLYVQEDRQKYLENDIFALYCKPVEESEIYLNLLAIIEKTFSEVKDKLQILNSLNADYPKVQADINDYLKLISNFSSAENESKHDLIANFEVPKLGTKKAENKDDIKESFRLINNALEKYKAVFNPKEDLKTIQKEINASKENLDLLINFVKKYDDKMLEFKKEMNAYSFADIEYFAYSILKREDVKDVLQEEIEYICVDEYQDVNKLQEYLITKIARKNNLFLVGDIKQSIYGFRQSEPKYFQAKLENFASEENTESVQSDLNENFRSDKNVLDYVNTIFSKFMTKELSGIDYENTSKLEGKNQYSNSADYPKVSIEIGLKEEEEILETSLYSVMNDQASVQTNAEIELEAEIIVNKILELIKLKVQNKNGEFEEVKFKDIAVLFRSKKALYEIVGKKLQDLKIPVCLNIKEDIYESLETRFLSHFLFLLISPMNDVSLSSVLSFPCLNFSKEELLQIANSQENKSFSFKVQQIISENGLDAVTQKLKELFDFIDYLRVFSISHSVYEIYCEIIKKFRLEEFLFSLPNGKIYLSNLKRVLSTVASSSLKKVNEYVNFLQTKAKIQKEMSVGGEENSVQLMTIHASKGLEFKCVILAGTANEMSRKNNENIIISEKGIGGDYLDTENKTKKATAVKSYLQQLDKEKQVEEEKRLLYVALTRPKNILVVTGIKSLKQFEKLDKYFEKEPNSYLDLILNSISRFELVSLIEKGSLSLPNTSTEFKLIAEKTEQEREETIEEKSIIDKNLKEKVKEFFDFNYPFNLATKVSAKSSVSHYLAEANNGETYVLEPKELKINEHLSHESNAEIGTAYHKCFELLDFSKSVTEADVLSVLEKMQTLGFKTAELDAQKILIGCEKIRKIMPKNAHIKKEQSFIMSIPHNELVESEIGDEVLVQGVVDLMFITENEIILIDFKNTKIQSKEKLKSKYSKQIELYEIAIKSSFECNKVTSYLYSIQNADLIKMG